MAIFRPKYRDQKSGELKQSRVFHYDFIFAGQRYRGSTEVTRKTLAVDFERQMKLRLERAMAGKPSDQPHMRIRTVSLALKDYAKAYEANHRPKSLALVKERSVHLERLLGSLVVTDLTEQRMAEYMTTRQKEGAGPRTVNLEGEVLSRVLGHTWRALWPKLKKLDEPKDRGKVFTADDEQAALDAARNSRSPYLYLFLRIAFEAGLRSGEVRQLRWGLVTFDVEAGGSFVRVGESKTEGGAGRLIPMTRVLHEALGEYREWYVSKLGNPKPHWFIFPFSSRQKPVDPERPLTTIKTAWQAIKADAGLSYRLHDARHTLATRLADSGMSELKMQALIGHTNKEILKRYVHLQAESMREGLERATAKPETTRKSDGVSKVSPKVKRSGRST